MDSTADSDESGLAVDHADMTDVFLLDDIATSTNKCADFTSTLQNSLEICK